MFNPAYAVIGKLLEGETVAKKAGVKVGDCIVAINQEGYRRFAPDFPEDGLEDLSQTMTKLDLSAEQKKVKNRVVTGKAPGEVYNDLLAKIKEVKKTADPNDPLTLYIERYGWDAGPNSWGRFLAARDGDVPAAMQMQQTHEAWKTATFPIDLTSPALQSILKLRAISEIDVGKVPTVYVNYAKLQSLENEQKPEDVVTAFVIATEIVLGKCDDPRQPKSCQLVDLTGVGISSGFRVDILKKVSDPFPLPIRYLTGYSHIFHRQIYASFEPNYPETLEMMIMYPVSKTVAYMAKTLLSFVNERTQKKFVLTDSLDKVCDELGWDKASVEAAGGLEAFAAQNDSSGNELIFQD